MARYLERMPHHRNTGWHEVWHWLYHPANFGRMTKYRVRVPLVHHVHLIPGRWIEAACFRYDGSQRPLRAVVRVVAPPPEPPVDFIAPPKIPDTELEDLRRRAHP